MKTIQAKVLLLLILVSLFSLGTSLMLIHQHVRAQVKEDLRDELDARFNLLSILMRSQEIALKKQTVLLAEEPTLKMSMETKDQRTVTDTMGQLQIMLQNSLFLTTTDTGQLLSSVKSDHEGYSTDKEKIVLEALDGDLGADFWEVNQKLYLVAISPVEFHDFIQGAVACGFELSSDYTKFLEAKAGVKVSLFVEDHLVASSWEFDQKDRELDKSEMFQVGNEQWFGQVYELELRSRKVQFLLQKSYSRAIRTLDSVRDKLAFLGVVIFLLAVLISFVFSHQLTRPIQGLTAAAHRLSEGDWETEVRVESSDELGSLSRSFESMRESLIRQRETIKSTEAMKKDLELAGKIQQSLLPRETPQITGVELFGKLIPSNQIGGDYYGYFPNSDGTLAIVIADVSGHGAASALLMAMARSTLQSLHGMTHEPDKLLAEVNRILHPDLVEAEAFISMFALYLNPHDRTLTYANAGHNFPLLFRKSKGLLELDTEGMLIGILEDVEFGKETVELDDSNLLVLYTDGLTEAMGKEGEGLFGEERLTQYLDTVKESSANQILDGLYDKVERFAGELAYRDDRTCVVLKCHFS